MRIEDLRGPAEANCRIEPDSLHSVVSGIFEKLGVPPGDARDAATVLVQADLLGVDSHGVSNYIQLIYRPGLKRGWINATPRIETVRETPISALIDGDGGLGLVVGTRAMELAVAKAEATGVGIVAVRNSRHYGMAGFYSMMALERDLIGLSLTNAEPLVTPTFGATRKLGTNPIAVAVPTGREAPFLLDMATSTVPYGKIMLARRLGIEIPTGWAADEDGLPTNDPEIAFKARNLLPLGGTREQSSHKGFGLGVVVDILTGILSGGGVPTEGNPANHVGHFFAALRVDAFLPIEEFREGLDEYLRDLLATPTMPGEDEVIYPGVIEERTKKERSELGIPLHQDVVDYLAKLASQLGVEAELVRRD